MHSYLVHLVGNSLITKSGGFCNYKELQRAKAGAFVTTKSGGFGVGKSGGFEVGKSGGFGVGKSGGFGVGKSGGFEAVKTGALVDQSGGFE
jgi:hypothetical protein